MCFRCEPRMAACCGARVTQKLPSISREWRACNQPVCFAKFHKKHGLRICTIQSLIAHRRKSEKLVELEQVVKMPTDYGDFDLHLYRSKLDGQHHLALVKGR